ncbi:MAG TPA: DUF5698 domain-containing protein [Tissierellaceae bacterium]|nr:DUF5698 domain-containing protein [Tissierellaceae bacterium]
MLGYLLIFFLRVIDVSLTTIRTLMVVQGRKLHAAIIGFFEVTIYIVALGKVVSSLDNPLNLLFYALGFATGNYVGITIENKIALGNLGAMIVLKTDDNQELIDTLRENKFGTTVLKGHGKDGPREVLNVALNRKDLMMLKNLVYQYDANAFITVNNINPVSGGFYSTKRK